MIKNVVLIVAHPDDETLWAGGTMLGNPSLNCYIISLCRRSDAERSAKFFQALKILNSDGIMGDLDDGPDQFPVDEKEIGQLILELLPDRHCDVIITHSPFGEYTRHKRHEEIGKAVFKLWNSGKISASELWIFAYEDGNKDYFPKAIENAHSYSKLTKEIWMRKYKMITETYGFDPKSWEAETTPKIEAFWQFTNPFVAKKWLDQSEYRNP